MKRTLLPPTTPRLSKVFVCDGSVIVTSLTVKHRTGFCSLPLQSTNVLQSSSRIHQGFAAFLSSPPMFCSLHLQSANILQPSAPIHQCQFCSLPLQSTRDLQSFSPVHQGFAVFLSSPPMFCSLPPRSTNVFQSSSPIHQCFAVFLSSPRCV